MNNLQKILKDKWFLNLIIIVIIVIIVFVFVISSEKTDNSEDVSSNDIKNDISNNESENETNPYQITNDYDGIYSFLLLDNNGSEKNQFNSVGAIEIKDGECTVKYKLISGNDTDINYYDREYEGFCGINKEDNSSFYLLIKDVIYKCTLSNNNLFGELKSDYNLSGCSNNKNLELIKMDGSNDLNSVYLQKFEEEKARMEKAKKEKEEQEKQAFISSCQTYTFEQMARNPDKFKGTNVKLTGEVVQVIDGFASKSLRVNITKNGRYSTYYTDTIYVNYMPKEGEDKILEDDIITIYGTAQGEYSYTSTIGTTITLPFVNGKYIILEK